MLLGRGAGDVIVKAMEGAKEKILVSSPWIGEEYARLLLGKALEGVKVFVVTTDLPDNEGKAFLSPEKYGEEEEKAASYEVTRLKFAERRARASAARDTALLAVLAALALAAALYLHLYASIALPLAAALAASAAAAAALRLRSAGSIRRQLLEAEAELERLAKRLAIEREKIRRNLSVLVVPASKAFVHAKLYVVDGRAWAGSANLTKSGMEHNYEVLVEVDAKAAEAKFLELWKELSTP
ncbi:MAG: phospholipase D-like domain-containing protein [Thermoproteus sp. AZ2]|uniref:Phospholipase D-like domain-containing protein n=1 Tax=Thermoproteus sp. AZ2 TaxID=1609232 RepID=A0ACC6V0M0_9CREN